MNNYTNYDNELADQLLLGSQNIDRMIDEMHRLTSMLAGSMVPILEDSLDRFEEMPNGLSFESKDRIVIWKVCILRASKKIDTGARKPTVDIGMYGYIQRRKIFPVFNSKDISPTSRVEIKSIYERRGVLVGGLLSAFPSLTQRMAHFIEASKVQFPD